jgi:hypothetical protein
MAATTLPARRSTPRALALTGQLRRPVAEIAAGVQVLLGAAVVLIAADKGSWIDSVHKGTFTPWFAGPLYGLLPRLTTDQALIQRTVGDIEIAMLAMWILILLGGRTIRAPVVIASVVTLNVLFVFCPLLRGTDVFNYLGYARLDVVQHLNPYVNLPLAQRGDPVYAYSNWHGLRSPYGPLFTIILLPTAWLPVPVAYWVYKVFTTLASLGLLGATWACARKMARPPAAAVAFVGLNPIVLMWGLGGKHTEFLMMALVMTGCLLAMSRREVLGGVSLAAAAAIKVSAGLLAPVIALGMPRSKRALLGLVAGAAGIAALTYAFFGPHIPDLRDQGRLVSDYSFPNLLGYAAGRGGADPGVRRLANVLMVAGVAVCALYAWRTRRWATAAGWAALVAVVTTTWLVPWYVIWALPLVALSTSRTLRVATLLVTVWFVLIWSWVAGPWLKDHGYRARATAVGKANYRFERSVLKDPSPVKMRKAAPSSGRSPKLPRRHGTLHRLKAPAPRPVSHSGGGSAARIPRGHARSVKR